MADVRPLKKGSTTQFAEMGGTDTIPASLIGIVPKFETPSGTVNGSNTAFTLSSTPVANASVIMILDGAVQTNGTDYTVSGTTVTFTTAPASGSEIVAIYNNAASIGGGDFSSNTSSSVDSEIVLFSGTGGKTGKRASGSGYAKLTSGVLSALTAAQLRSETAANVISPSQITGDQDDYAPSGFSDATVVRISGDSSIRAITGFTASGAYDGQQKRIINVGSYPVYFPGEHPDSTAANRIDTEIDILLYPKESVTITYDSTSSRWRLCSASLRLVGRTLFYSVSASTVTAGDFYNVAFLSIGTGSNGVGVATSTVPGYFQLSTASSATAGYIMYFAKNLATFSYFSSAHIWADFFFHIPTLSDGTQTFTVCTQITATPTSTSETPNNTVGIRYGSAVNSGKFLGFSRNNAGSESTVDLGITVAAATLYRLRVEVDKSKTEVRFYVDGVMLGRVTGNMPNSVAVGTRIVILKSAGTTAGIIRVHAMSSGATYA